jgi:glucose-1-phosphate adenylyltransferase
MAPIYSRPRHLAASKLNSCTVDHSIVAEGCIVTNTNLNRCIIGIRSIIRSGSQLENVYMMGADRYERLDQLSDNEYNHHPHLGIGKNCYIRNAIIDRNVRIGNNVRLSPESKPDGFHQGPVFIKDGILCIAKDGVIPDNTIL